MTGLQNYLANQIIPGGLYVIKILTIVFSAKISNKVE